MVGICARRIRAEEGAARPGVEEIIVTSQRTEENIQDVPIAVTAFTGAMMEEKQIVTPSDLQLNAPNVSFTATNFGANSFSIRGIGRLVTASTGDAGVSTHINEIPFATNLTAVEFYDMERVEVLRGPQGTLYGKNATGGVLNFVTKMPDFDGVSGHVDMEVGDYDSKRAKGALNVPLSDTFALRVAAMKLERDGYTDNTAFGQVGRDGRVLTGIDDDIDGRDISTYRITAKWDIADNMDAWVMYGNYNEGDDRARITNQVCVRGPIPTYGCLPDAVGFEQPNQMSNFFNLVASLYSLVPPNRDLTGVYNWPRDSVGLRQMHTDFEPIYEFDEELWSGGFNYEFDSFRVGIIGGYQESDSLYSQDYNMDVGPELVNAATGAPLINFFRDDGLWPISRPAGRAGDDWRAGQCNAFDGTSGVPGGCILSNNISRTFIYDQSDF